MIGTLCGVQADWWVEAPPTMRRRSHPIKLHGEVDFNRASHLAVCSCGQEYWQHQLYEWADGDMALYLHRICNGDFIKP